MREWIAVLRAADTAARWHVHQRRKGIAQEPYINHLLEVASLVSEATSGSDATVVIAALLHDAVEDQEVPVEMIAREFGKQVADIVMEVTDDKTLPKIADNALRFMLALDGGGHDLVVSRLHAVELEFAHEVEELSAFHQMVLLRLS